MTPFVYHAVPNAMVGDVIYPLNELAPVVPAAYELQRGKYRDREAVLDARITEEGLLFNGTVHCAPLHPYRLFAARRELGFNPPPAQASPDAGKYFGGLFFEIPVGRIITHQTFWYRWETPWINGYPSEDVPARPPLDEFEQFDLDRYQELGDVPAAHRSYLRRMKDEGRRPLTFVHIPHVLVAGAIDIRGLRVIPWDQPPAGG
ncbi:MAG: hypothetical protein QOF27_356 [Gaiellaceae bacterium]|nr:hypothetical protein [Gaiellaceae bacterium]